MGKKELMVVATDEQMDILDSMYPQDNENLQGIRLPRLGFLSKDIIEESGTGKNKKIKVVQASGTFFTEKETDEDEDIIDEKGKKTGTRKKWETTYLDEEELDMVIFFHRKQLRFYDEANGSYITSPIYDSAEEIVPLFSGRSEIARGTQAELQAKYPALTAKGKPTSKLKATKILYVLYEGEIYQFGLSESSKYAFQTYEKTNQPQKLITTVGSIEQTKGTNTYRQNTFVAKGPITSAQATQVIDEVKQIKAYLQAKNAKFAPKPVIGGGFEDFKDHLAEPVLPN